LQILERRKSTLDYDENPHWKETLVQYSQKVWTGIFDDTAIEPFFTEDKTDSRQI